MIAHDDAFLDDVALLALGVLPLAEAERVAEHLRTCEVCRTEYAQLRATADMLGYAAVETTSSDEVAAARLKDRVMTSVLGNNGLASVAMPERNTSEAGAQAMPPVVAPIPLERRRRGSYLAYGAAAAAAIVAVASISNNIGLRRERAHDRGQIAQLQRRTDSLDGALGEVVAPDSKRYPVPGGQVITRGGRVIVALRGLPAPAPGKVYQAWTLANGAKAVSPSLTFTPDANGIAVIELPQSAANLAAVAVSVEPTGGSKAPTSKPKFIRKLS